MKNLKQFLEIILLLFSLINCEDRRATFAENIRSYANSIIKPTRADELVSDFQNKLTLLFYTLTLDEINQVQVKFDLSDSLTLQIKAAPYARVSGAIKVEEEISSGFFAFEKTLGAAIREDDGRITFALIKTKSFANLKIKYDTYTEKECKRTFIFFKKCHDVIKQRERELTEGELSTVKDAIKYSAVNSILDAVDILKRGDYELYMTDTGSIFSPDHQSVAHLTYFGNIAIGPTSELNSILPIDYEYVKDSFNNGHLTKKIKSDFVYLSDYPILKKLNYGSLIIKKGYFHKFNFILKNKVKMFPSYYNNYMKKASSEGPYVLEVKKNGNVILYQKNYEENILWQTNTANKGTGPYNFHLTNDKILILEDSKGEILYQSSKYKNLPTILYGNSGIKGDHVYNGLKINAIGRVPLNNIHITTDNSNYVLFYGGYAKEINKDVHYLSSNKGVYPNSYVFENFYVDFNSLNNDFDICYSAQLPNLGWTKIGCNGEKVGYEVTESTRRDSDVGNYYIQALIIYVKDKEEDVPELNNDVPLLTTV